MSDYDALTAHYYAAYRPPLHGNLLARVLSGRQGRALATYCEHVIGIDPSADMLWLAGTTTGIRYQQVQGPDLPFPDRQFDVVTLAGSLYYAKSAKLLDEGLRVEKPGAQIIVYDFSMSVEG